MPRMAKRPHVPFRVPFFRIFYSTTYTTLFIVTLLLLAITPAALIYNALSAGAYQYICEIGGVYILVAVMTVFIYSSRLYTNRTVLAAVGKSWIPVEDGEVSKNVRKMIAAALARSAVIARESRPRDLHNHLDRFHTTSTHSTDGPKLAKIGRIVKIDPEDPPWGHIAHAGWSSPSRMDTNVAPHIYFRTVVHELPNLIEARAVSLAPPDPSFRPSTPDELAPADYRVVSLLRRRPTANLRTYLAHLAELGLVTSPETGDDFLARYEYARFSPVPLTEPEFQDLMSTFASLLAGMGHLPPHLVTVARSQAAASAAGDSDGASLASSSARSASLASSVACSVVRPRPSSSRLPSFYTPAASFYSSARTPSPTMQRAPSHSAPRPHTFQTANTVFRTPSQQTFGSAGSVLRLAPSNDSGFPSSAGSISSRRPSVRSQRSVIRLTPSPAPGRLPYEWVGDGG